MNNLYIYSEPSAAEIAQRTNYRKKNFTNEEREYLLIMSYLSQGGKGWITGILKTLREKNDNKKDIDVWTEQLISGELQ